ncbi:MAG TPA: O-antigen ligase family protein [Acidimicrobiales bacterium]|nr:O-antigen ligase family protein [Acidimicrobiales bacterium]
MPTRTSTDTVARTSNDILAVWAYRLVIVGVFLIPFTRFRGGGIQVSDLIFAVSIAVLAFSKKRANVERMALSWHLATFLVVVGGIGATVNAIQPAGSVLVIVRMVFVLFYWPWVIRHVLINQRQKHIAMYAFVLGCAFSGFVEILQSKLHILALPATVTGGRATAFTIQPDELGACLALGLVFAIGLTMELGPGRRWHRVISIGLIGIGLVLSASVSAILSALAAVFVLLVLRKVNLRKVLTAVLVVVIVYVGGVSVLGSGNKSLDPLTKFNSTIGNGTTSNTASLRIDTYKSAWHGIVEDPVFGHGLDLYSGIVFYDIYLGVGYPPHNLILIMWYQGGILFLIGSLIAVGAAFRRVSGPGRRDPTRDIIFAGAIASLVYSMTAPVIFQTYFWLPFVLAMTYSMDRRPATAASGTGQPADVVPPGVNGSSPSALPAPVAGS